MKNLSRLLSFAFVLLLVGCSSLDTTSKSDLVVSGLEIKIKKNEDICYAHTTGILSVKFPEMFNIADRIEKLQCKTTVFVLNFEGGDINSAMQIGDWIRRNQHSTLIYNSRCQSACSAVFLGGQQRLVTNQSSLGVHMVREEKTNKCYDFRGFNAIRIEEQQTIEKIRSYVNRMLGVNAGKAYIDLAASAGCDRMRFVSNTDLVKTKIATLYSEPNALKILD